MSNERPIDLDSALGARDSASLEENLKKFLLWDFSDAIHHFNFNALAQAIHIRLRHEFGLMQGDMAHENLDQIGRPFAQLMQAPDSH